MRALERPTGDIRDVALNEMLHSLLDGRARWPDGSLRTHRATEQGAQGGCRKITLAGQVQP